MSEVPLHISRSRLIPIDAMHSVSLIFVWSMDYGFFKLAQSKRQADRCLCDSFSCAGE